jgi:cold shock CspA family protein
MKLENIINSVKKQTRKAVLCTILAAGAALVGCDKLIIPIGPQIKYAVYLPTETKFSGDSFQVEFQPLEKPYQKVEARGDRPGQPFCEWIELHDGNQDGKYSLALSSTPFYGDYHVQFRTTSGDEITESPIYTVVMNMNEAQSDAKLNAILTPLVKAGSTTDYDITNAWFNTDHIFGFPTSHTYNNDAELLIHDSSIAGNQRSYIIDVQGSATDVYNSAKEADADSVAISYKNIGPVSSDSDLEAKINELKNDNWPRTDN